MFYVVIGLLSLLCGLIIYLFFRPNTYISQIIFKIISVKQINLVQNWVGIGLFKFYFADFLWAFSLSCFLYAIYLPNSKNAMLCSMIVLLVGLFYELMQHFKVISGTGDIVDVLFYLLAAVAVNIINFLRRKRNEKQRDY